MGIEDVLAHPAFWIVVAAASELIGMSKLKDNSVVQLLFTVLRSLKAKKGWSLLMGFGFGGLTLEQMASVYDVLLKRESFTRFYLKGWIKPLTKRQRSLTLS